MASTPTVLVIGGGATGTGIARDLSMRGIEVHLVERGPLASGTTGRMHGLLHSGARYANDDPESAADCAVENEILRDIAGHCVRDTGGLFVPGPADDRAYFEAKAEACTACGIDVERLSGADARALEPTLSDGIDRALWVPDATVDSPSVTVATALAAEANGARISTETAVVDIVTEDHRVTGAVLDGDARTTVGVDHVVNATGPWADRVAALAGCDFDMRHSKGSMVVLAFPALETVVNWCRPKGQADIVVPFTDDVVLGTTDLPVEDSDEVRVDPCEVEELRTEIATLVPGLREATVERSYAGVRPLYAPNTTGATETEHVTRDFFVLDHAATDGVEGFTSVVGGKFTTHRRMAERTADHVASRLDVDEPSRTAEVALPGRDDPSVLEAAAARFGVASQLPVAGGDGWS